MLDLKVRLDSLVPPDHKDPGAPLVSQDLMVTEVSRDLQETP